MLRELGVVGMLLTLAAPAAGQPAPTMAVVKVVPASRVFPYLDAYLKLPPAERTLFAPGYYLSRKGVPAGDMRVTLVGEAGRRALALAPDGRVTSLPTLAEFRTAKIEVQSSAGPGPMSSVLKPVASIRPAPELNAVEVAQAIRQCNAGMHKAAGLMAALVPVIARAVFTDSGGGSAVKSDGTTTPLPGGSRPYYEPGTLSNVVTLRLTRTPSAILLGSASDKR